MKQSYCGLGETCLIDDPDFLEAIAKVKEYLDQFPITWWATVSRGMGVFLSLNSARVCIGFSATDAWAAREGKAQRNVPSASAP